MKIEVGKIYLTRGGQKARVLCTDLKGTDYPVICAIVDNNIGGETIYSYTTKGFRWENNITSGYNLVAEYSPWNDIEIDTPIYVKEDSDWIPRYFAKYENGMVFVWNCGQTSFTVTSNTHTTPWNNAKLAKDK